MRKALIGMILAATAMTPVAAWAQDEEREYRRGGEGRQARSEQRIERQQARQEARQQRQEARQQPVEARSDVQRSDVARQRSRGEWGEARRAERSRRAWGDVQRSDQATQQQVERRERRAERELRRVEAGERNSAYPSAWQGNPNDPRRQRYERLERRNQFRHGNAEQREQVRREWQDRGEWRDDRDGRRDWRRDRDRDRRDWRRSWNRHAWRNDHRYDWQSWRFRNRHLFRLSPYFSPYRHHRYSRFSIGLFLEPLFYSSRYWVNDPFHYRLPPAPPGTQWVRYYNDVLLVDTWTGEVVDVIYDFFW